jgi:hypothetical protein
MARMPGRDETQLDSTEVAAWLKDAPARRNDDLRPDSRASILARIRALQATLPRQESEPGAMEELAREFEDWSDLRRAATTVMLGCDDEEA